MKKAKVYIIDARRTPVTRYCGPFTTVHPVDLLVPVIRALLDRHPKLKETVEQVIVGNVLSAGHGQNPAREAAIKAGLNQTVSAHMVNMVCGSGMKSIALASEAIKAGSADVILCGGVEIMSATPYYLDGYRTGVKFGNQNIRDGMITDGLQCTIIGKHMGKTAEAIAQKYGISRASQDEYAFQSHSKAGNAIKSGVFVDEIVPIHVNGEQIETDQQPRSDTTIKKLAQLKPIFAREGSVTAGNSSSLNDGCAMLALASEKAVTKYGFTPLATIEASAEVGVDPEMMGIGAYTAADAVLKRTNLSIDEIDAFELNEAFASQSLAVIKELRANPDTINIQGGAIALGHPIGASGARIVTTLVHMLKNKKSATGLASLCIGGGQGIATIIKV